MPANNNVSRIILRMFIAITQDKKMTYDSYVEYEEISRPVYINSIKELKKAFNDLEITGQIVKDTDTNPLSESFNADTYFYIGNNSNVYDYSIDLLTDGLKKKYIFLIIYLMLLARHFVSLSFVENLINIKLTKSKFAEMIYDISDIVGIDIKKNELGSYEIVED